MRRGRSLTSDELELWRYITRNDAQLSRRRRAEVRDPPSAQSQDMAASGNVDSPASGLGAAARRPHKAAPTPGPPALPEVHLTPLQSVKIHRTGRDPGRGVRRGKVQVDGRLDLHGYTQEGAYAALRAYLATAVRRGLGCVLVITGRAPAPGATFWPEAPRGVIRLRLPDWLDAPELKPLVSGWSQAHTRHGGAGAVYVFLRRR